MKTPRRNLKKEIRIVLAGHFQQGKSTLSRLLVPNSKAICGDGTQPTTNDEIDCVTECRSIAIVDTPGVNGKPEHDEKACKSLQSADLVLFVVMTEKTLPECVTAHFKKVAEMQIPVILVINCKDPAGEERNDPAAAEKCNVTKAIIQQIANLGVKIIKQFVVNLAWAAASRGLLEKDHRLTKSILRNYRYIFPEESNDQNMYMYSRFESLYEYLIVPSGDLFSENGILKHALQGRIHRILRTTTQH